MFLFDTVYAACGRRLCDYGLGNSNKPRKRVRQPAYSDLEGCPINYQVVCEQQHLARAHRSMCLEWTDGGPVQPHELHCPAEVGYSCVQRGMQHMLHAMALQELCFNAVSTRQEATPL